MTCGIQAQKLFSVLTKSKQYRNFGVKKKIIADRVFQLNAGLD